MLKSTSISRSFAPSRMNSATIDEVRESHEGEGNSMGRMPTIFGARKMNAESFCSGHKIPVGSILGLPGQG